MPWQSVTQGSSGLLLAYLLVALPMGGGLLHGRAPTVRYLSWPFAAAIATLATAVIWALVGTLLHGALQLPGAGPLWEGVGAVFFALSGYAAGRLLARTAPAVALKRGALIEEGATARGAAVAAARRESRAGLTLAGVALPLEDETKHFKLIGTTGTGKSTAIRELLRPALARGDR
ncbi:MAG TPA: type IV secretion system DNA-binding domain-containing protein, partial [Steroidobacteraceae bacterium]